MFFIPSYITLLSPDLAEGGGKTPPLSEARKHHLESHFFNRHVEGKPHIQESRKNKPHRS